MNARMSRLSVLALGLIVAIAVALGFQQDRSNGTGVQARVDAPSVKNPAAVAFLALPSGSDGTTLSLTRVYSQPDQSSTVVDILTPSTLVQVMGRSVDSRWVALSSQGQDRPAGWVISSDLAIVRNLGTVQNLAVVFDQPNQAASTLNVFSPGQMVEVMGISFDGDYYALKMDGANTTGYVPAAYVRLALQQAETTTLTKVYQSMDESSPVVTVLPPGRQVEIRVQNGKHGWVILSGSEPETFNGYTRLNNLAVADEMQKLPVITGHAMGQ